jgi:hypothetical protein
MLCAQPFWHDDEELQENVASSCFHHQEATAWKSEESLSDRMCAL